MLSYKKITSTSLKSFKSGKTYLTALIITVPTIVYVIVSSILLSSFNYQLNEILNNFYQNYCDEDTRLDPKHRQLEFFTTDRYVQKYLKPGCRIIEIGAGTGKYSLYYAKQGYQVNSIEYVKHNLDVLKSKSKSMS